MGLVETDWDHVWRLVIAFVCCLLRRPLIPLTCRSAVGFEYVFGVTPHFFCCPPSQVKLGEAYKFNFWSSTVHGTVVFGAEHTFLFLFSFFFLILSDHSFLNLSCTGSREGSMDGSVHRNGWLVARMPCFETRTIQTK